jgi:two-component system, NarL family, invasion response regulator UvrY
MIKLLVIDDHAVVRQGIRQILSATDDIVVARDAVTAADARAHAGQSDCDAILLDLSLPDSDGLELLKELRAGHPRRPILVLSMHPEDQFALRAIRAGASGYLTKNSAPDELVSAIRKVVKGEYYLSPWIAERLAREASGDPSKPPHEQLSDREYQVLMRIASGKTTKDIASELCISPKTVGTYRNRLATKMGLASDAELTAYVFRNRLLD